MAFHTSFSQLPLYTWSFSSVVWCGFYLAIGESKHILKLGNCDCKTTKITKGLQGQRQELKPLVTLTEVTGSVESDLLICWIYCKVHLCFQTFGEKAAWRDKRNFMYIWSFRTYLNWTLWFKYVITIKISIDLEVGSCYERRWLLAVCAVWEAI